MRTWRASAPLILLILFMPNTHKSDVGKPCGTFWKNVDTKLRKTRFWAPQLLLRSSLVFISPVVLHRKTALFIYFFLAFCLMFVALLLLGFFYIFCLCCWVLTWNTFYCHDVFFNATKRYNATFIDIHCDASTFCRFLDYRFLGSFI